MKNSYRLIVMFLAALFLPAVGFADGALDTPAQAKRVMSKIQDGVMSIDGVNSIGISGCQPKTGKPFEHGQPFVHCVKITTMTDAAYETLSNLYPLGSKLDGVYIVVENIGEITPQLRVSGGN